MDAVGAIIPLVVFAFLLIISVPILVSMALAAAVFFYLNGFSLLPMGQVPFTGVNSFPYLAIPLFVLTGDLITHSGIVKDLIRLSRAILGWTRGGLGMTTLVACGFFAAISGSNAATTAALGKMMIPEMEKRGYAKDYAAALAAAGGCMGIIIPPSIAYIIYGATTSVPVSALFVGSILPGTLMIAFMCIANYVYCKKYDYDPAQDRFSFVELGRAIWSAKWGLIAPIIILGSIYGGIATPTEAAAVAVLYCLVVGLAVGKMKLKDLPGLLISSALVVGVVAPVIAMAILLSEPIAMLKLTNLFVGSLLSITQSKFGLMFLMYLILMIAGCVMETTPNILLLAPLMIPVVDQLGLDPVHWGVCMMTTLTIGFITPPVGLNLYVASSITELSVTRIAWNALPFVIAMSCSLIFIYGFPWLTLYLTQFIK